MIYGSIIFKSRGGSVARCREPVNVIYCYITILIQLEALISLLDESVLSPTFQQVMLVQWIKMKENGDSNFGLIQ